MPIEFYEGEFTNDKIASIMMKAGLNGVFPSKTMQMGPSVVRDMFSELKSALVGEGTSKIKVIDLLK